MDPCAFDNEKLVRDNRVPLQFRYYPAFDFRQVSCTLREFQRDHGGIPESKAKLVERVKGSIAEEGMRNPLVVEWFTEDPRKPLRWMVTIGNNRYLAIDELGWETCEAMIVWPTDTVVPELSGDYETLPFLVALAHFDATYPWWNSENFRRAFPTLVPRCV